MQEISDRLLHVETKVDDLSSTVSRIDTRLGSMASSIAYIAEQFSKPKILPILVFINFITTAIILTVMFFS